MALRNKTLLAKGDLNRAPSAIGTYTGSTPDLSFAVRNLLPFQSSFEALKSAGTYKGFEWPAVYEISNPTGFNSGNRI